MGGGSSRHRSPAAEGGGGHAKQAKKGYFLHSETLLLRFSSSRISRSPCFVSARRGCSSREGSGAAGPVRCRHQRHWRRRGSRQVHQRYDLANDKPLTSSCCVFRGCVQCCSNSSLFVCIRRQVGGGVSQGLLEAQQRRERCQSSGQGAGGHQGMARQQPLCGRGGELMSVGLDPRGAPE